MLLIMVVDECCYGSQIMLSHFIADCITVEKAPLFRVYYVGRNVSSVDGGIRDYGKYAAIML